MMFVLESLKKELARAQNGDAFVLQGGDCSENFEECRSEIIVQKLKILTQNRPKEGDLIFYMHGD